MKKRVCDSETEQVQIISKADLNGYNRLFGGQLMEWIDIVAAVTARRHCGKNVTTILVDTLYFKEAAHSNDLIVLKGKITYVGRTSMEVCVRSYVENLDGMRHLINTAYVLMVALDENERPIEVPGLIPETPEELMDWENGKKRCAMRKERRTVGY